ncbi:hypothetical protein C0V97_00965 [Asaia sp. W19]|uniref:hypothetical protein n=1 Tax=unclassified Asaia TaxID=2685023 RepID=UPI000F8CA340|nr:hypothetical protein [Asaia sp. W19]RUT27370.1 hypothetical protein C0V97_00965 [Asaia sp. W19]
MTQTRYEACLSLLEQIEQQADLIEDRYPKEDGCYGSCESEAGEIRVAAHKLGVLLKAARAQPLGMEGGGKEPIIWALLDLDCCNVLAITDELKHVESLNAKFGYPVMTPLFAAIPEEELQTERRKEQGRLLHALDSEVERIHAHCCSGADMTVLWRELRNLSARIVGITEPSNALNDRVKGYFVFKGELVDALNELVRVQEDFGQADRADLQGQITAAPQHMARLAYAVREVIGAWRTVREGDAP